MTCMRGMRPAISRVFILDHARVFSERRGQNLYTYDNKTNIYGLRCSFRHESHIGTTFSLYPIKTLFHESYSI